jgi:hypothetical protein
MWPWTILNQILSLLGELLAGQAITNQRLLDLEKTVAQLDTDIAALQADVTQLTTVVGSATALINGIAAQIQTAVQAALAAGATPAQLSAIEAVGTALVSQSSGLAAAVAANTPAPVVPPAP